MNYERRKSLHGFLFALPAMIFFSVLFVYPVFSMFYLSFHSWGLVDVPRFVGLWNYYLMWNDPGFFQSLQVTLYYVLAMFAIGPLILGLALVFNRELKFKNLLWGLYFMPYIISLVFSSLAWKLIYNPTSGLFTLITDPLGLHIPWLTDDKYAMPAIVLYSLWVYAGYYMTLWIAGLEGIPKEYYEAAAIDGAGKWAVFRHITLPLLKPITFFVIIVSLVGAFQMFVPFFVMTRGGPADATRVLSYYIYQNAFQFLNMGYASTLTVMMFLIVFTISVVQIRLFRE